MQGEIIALIGGNGAGKTTTLRTISGMQKPRSGTLNYLGKSIAGSRPDTIMLQGMSHVPEGRRIFPQLTVRENLEIGAYTVSDRAVINQRIQEGFEFFPRDSRSARSSSAERCRAANSRCSPLPAR